jgi:hypothetical protein
LRPIKRTQDVLGAVKASHKMTSTRRHAHPHKLSELDDIEIQDDDRLGEIDVKAGEGRDVNNSSENPREVVLFPLEDARTRSLKWEALLADIFSD